jgi:hypothetical protein
MKASAINGDDVLAVAAHQGQSTAAFHSAHGDAGALLAFVGA